MHQRFSNVLVVDDSEVTRTMLVQGLEAAGYSAVAAADGTEALEIIQESCPDYLITDWQMPIMNGEMLCRCVRSGGHERYIYLIIMTAHSDMLTVVDGLGSGADDYITKPIDLNELLARMQSGARILELDRRLTHVAEHDPLTGILNRRSLIHTVDRIIEVCCRSGRPASCIMMDLDHFKRVNDEHGHLAGDSVLVQVADLLSRRFRATDCVCRYGGEEFAIVLPECNEENAMRCAERCRQDIEHFAEIHGISESTITASFGVAEARPEETSLQLIDHADAALRAAKQAGRNRVVSFSGLKAAMYPSLDLSSPVDSVSMSS